MESMKQRKQCKCPGSDRNLYLGRVESPLWAKERKVSDNKEVDLEGAMSKTTR